jgi:acyl-CoA synthetase (AMP-forming)/AMP-acid ligase II
VTAVGVPHPKWGQTVVVAVQLGPGGMLTEGDVLDHCRTALAPYKKPTAVVFVHELPRTVSLKVPRAQVRAALAAKLAARPGAAQ